MSGKDYNDIIEELFGELQAAHKAYHENGEQLLLAVREKAKRLFADGEITDQDLEIFVDMDKDFASGESE